MPHDQHLADRIRQALSRTPHVTEKQMMGGLCFMVDGKMCINVTRKGDVMQRCPPHLTQQLVNKPGVSLFVMNGKPLQQGWLRLTPEAVDAEDDLLYWVHIALEGNKLAESKSRSVRNSK